MNDQNKPAEDGSEPNSSLPPTEIAEPVHAPASEPATAEQLQAVEQQTNSFEKATLRWAKLAVFMSAIAALFVCLQWYEMHTGGQDTHDLAVAAGKQADAAAKQADSARLQLEEMKKQVSDTHDLALAAKDQANAAQKTADTAHDTLTRSNRPWVGVESVQITQPIGFLKAGDGKDPTYFVNGSLEIIIKNFGSSPALSVKTFMEAYDPSFFTKEKFDPKEPFAQLRKVGESTCAVADGANGFTKKSPKLFGGSIFPTEGVTYNSGIPGFAKHEFQVGQFIQLVGCIVYRDQFGEMTHHTHYCFVAPVGKTGTVNNCESNSDAD